MGLFSKKDAAAKAAKAREKALKAAFKASNKSNKKAGHGKTNYKGEKR